MAAWYCFHCDQYFDTNEQDHADFSRDMCESCVDRESETCDPSPPKDDREDPKRVVVAGTKDMEEGPLNKKYAETVIASAFDAIIGSGSQKVCEACEAPSIGQYCAECEYELNQLNEQYYQTWMDELDQDDQAIEDFCNAD